MPPTQQYRGITRRKFLGYSGIAAGGIAAAVLGCGLREESVEELEQKVARLRAEKVARLRAEKVARLREESVEELEQKVAEYTIKKGGKDITGITGNRYGPNTRTYIKEIPSNDPFLPPISVRVNQKQGENPYLFVLEATLDPSEGKEVSRLFSRYVPSLYGANRLYHTFWKDLRDPHKPFDQNPSSEYLISSFWQLGGPFHKFGDLSKQRRDAVKNLYVDILREIIKYYEAQSRGKSN